LAALLKLKNAVFLQKNLIQFDDCLGFQNEVLGVLDIDDTGLEAFGDEDRVGLEAVVKVLGYRIAIGNDTEFHVRDSSSIYNSLKIKSST
jgi:hypothetical protein